MIGRKLKLTVGPLRADDQDLFTGVFRLLEVGGWLNYPIDVPKYVASV